MADPLLSAGGEILTWYDYFHAPFGTAAAEPAATPGGGQSTRRRKVRRELATQVHTLPQLPIGARPDQMDVDDDELLLLQVVA